MPIFIIKTENQDGIRFTYSVPAENDEQAQEAWQNSAFYDPAETIVSCYQLPTNTITAITIQSI